MAITQVILILFLVPLAALIFRFPELGLVLCLVVGSLLKGIVQPFLGPFDITVYLFAVTYGSIFIRSCMEKKLVLPDLRINIGVLLLIALLLASIIYTPLSKQGAEVFLRFVFLTISMLYATCMWCINIKRLKKLLFILIGVVITYSAFAFVWIFLLGQEQPTGTRAPFSETPVLGMAQLLAAVIPIAFILSKFVRTKSKRLLLQVLIIVAIVELIALNSRGPIIAFLAGAVCLFLLYSPGEKKRFALIAIPTIIVIICAFFLLPAEYTNRYALLTDIQSTSIAARLNMLHFVTDHFSDWFFTGAGLFGFGYYYNHIGTLPALWIDSPHNIFLDVFAAIGFFGLLVFSWLIGSFIYRGIKISRILEQPVHLLGLATVMPLIIFLFAGKFK